MGWEVRATSREGAVSKGSWGVVGSKEENIDSVQILFLLL